MSVINIGVKQKLQSALKQQLSDGLLSLIKVFQAFDKDNSGTLTYINFI